MFLGHVTLSKALVSVSGKKTKTQEASLGLDYIPCLAQGGSGLLCLQMVQTKQWYSLETGLRKPLVSAVCP